MSVGKGTIVVALLADLGPTIEGGRLMVNRTFLWTSLRDRLRQLRDASGEFNTHLVAVLVARPALPSPWGDEPLLLVDTSPLRSFVEKDADGDSRRNPLHAAIVRWLVDEIQRFGGIPAVPDDPDGLVVLSPFRAQLKLLRRRLPRDLFARAFELSTVHKYQGDECGTVLLDLVDARGLPRPSRFLQATRLSDDGARLLNVALSRARRRFLLVADGEHGLRHARPGPVKQFVSYMSRDAARIELPQEHVRSALTFVERWEGER